MIINGVERELVNMYSITPYPHLFILSELRKRGLTYPISDSIFSLITPSGIAVMKNYEQVAYELYGEKYFKPLTKKQKVRVFIYKLKEKIKKLWLTK